MHPKKSTMYNAVMILRLLRVWPWVGVGIVLGLPFVSQWLWWLVFVGVGWFYWLLQNDVRTARQFLWRGWVAGFVQALFVLSWGFSTYPLLWLGVTSPVLASMLIFGYWLVTAAVLGVGAALLAGVMSHLKRLPSHIFYFPFAWLLMDLWSAYLYSILFWGEGGGFNLHFSFGTLGYPLLAVRWFDGLIAWGTVYAGTVFVVGLSVAIVASGLYRYDIWYRRYAWGLLSGLMLAVGLSMSMMPPVVKSEGQRVITVDTRFSSALLGTSGGSETKTRSLHEAVQAALRYEPDVIILPEDSRYLQKIGMIADALDELQVLGIEDVVLIDSGRQTNRAGQVVLRGVTQNRDSGMQVLRDKYYLTPQGEFVPYVVSGLLRWWPDEVWQERIFDHLQYRPGAELAPKLEPGMPALLFCMESVSPWVSRQVALSSGATFVAHPVSHAWFAESSILKLQMYYMLRARSLEVGLPIVMAANMTNGYMVTPQGAIDSGLFLEQGELWSLREFLP